MSAASIQLPIVINGQPIHTSSDLLVNNPYNGQLVAKVAMGDASHLDHAINAASKAFAEASKQPPHARAELLLKVAGKLQERKQELAESITAESGKPIVLAEAEVARAIVTFTDAAAEARKWPGELLDASAYPTGSGFFAISKRFPVGVVYGLSPFNFPINLVAHKIAPAIACGASIVIKPSPRTPIGAINLVNIITEAGAIPGQVNVVTAPNELAARPVADDRVKVVSFTGSAPIGWQIKQQANKKKVILELGGNAAVIVHDDADLETAVPMIAAGAFGYAGQTCISVQRIIVSKHIYKSFRDKLVAYVNDKIKTGDPMSREVLVGPMITAEAQDRVLAQLTSAEKHGATILTGGEKNGRCITPALLENVPATHPFICEEAFAPIAVLIPADDFDSALRFANDSKFGLQTGVFTRDIGRIMQAFHTLETGSVLINQTPTFRIDNIPYGGVRDSGFGREGARWAIEDMTELRTLVIRQG